MKVLDPPQQHPNVFLDGTTLVLSYQPFDLP